jgi:uncharacterized protein (UPF0261 family)
MSSHVVVLGTLDTKGEVFAYVVDELRSLGVVPTLIDFGVFEPQGAVADIPASEVARRGGSELDALRVAREGSDTRAAAMAVMAAGLKALLADLREQGRCDAVIGLGGSGGSSVISAAMRSLPLGVPKFLVSTMASGNTAGFVGESDMVMMHSVTDIINLNRVSRSVLSNAARAVAGMAAGKQDTSSGERPLIALTMFGVTTPCVLAVTHALETRGFETVVFHAVGSGGRAMENLIREGVVDGVVDITTSELVDEQLGGVFQGTPERLTVAGSMHIPAVTVPGAMEVLNFTTVDSVPAKYNVPERNLIVHNPNVCAVRVNQEESAELGRVFAQRLAGAAATTRMVIPTRGFSNYCKEPDGPWVDRAKDQAFIDAFQATKDPALPVRLVEANINEPAFAGALVEEFLALWSETRELPKEA